MKYIEKILTDNREHENNCWVAVKGSFNLGIINDFDLNESIEGYANLVLYGWKNKEAFLNNAEYSDIRTIQIKLNDIQAFEAMWAEIAGKIITDETSQFLSGQLLDI